MRGLVPGIAVDETEVSISVSEVLTVCESSS
jgi:hypothetical protein